MKTIDRDEVIPRAIYHQIDQIHEQEQQKQAHTSKGIKESNRTYVRVIQ